MASINHDPTLSPGEEYLEILETYQSGGKKFPKPSSFKHFEIFTDGSATDQAKTFHKKHLRRAGIGIYHPASNTQIALPFSLPNPTNNRAEFLAALTALHWVEKVTDHLSLKEQSKLKIIIYTDCMLLVNSMKKWIKGWKRRGWKKSSGEVPKNKELLVQLDQMVTNLFPKTEWIHIKAAHNRKRPKEKRAAWLWDGNNKADHLADEGRKIAEKA